MQTHTASRDEGHWGRQAVLIACAADVIVRVARMEGATRPPDDAEGATVPEDLMSEQGALNHCLLMYKEEMCRVQASTAVSPPVCQQTANLVYRFVEADHEQNEAKDMGAVF